MTPSRSSTKPAWPRLAPLLLAVQLGLAGCGGSDLLLPSAGQPAKISIVSGDGQTGTVGQPLGKPIVVAVTDPENRPVEVVVLDQNGDRVTSQEIEVKLDLIGERDGRLRGHTRQWTESGVATFSDLKVEREGNYQLRASADGLPSVDSDRFEVQHD